MSGEKGNRAECKGGQRNEGCHRGCGDAGLPPAMVSRPSPFKSRCLAILNFKNGVCILPARNTPSPSTLPLRLCPRLALEQPLNSPSAAAARRAASECIVYAAIRETYCRPANNERFPRGISVVFIFQQPATLRRPSSLREPTGYPTPRSAIRRMPPARDSLFRRYSRRFSPRRNPRSNNVGPDLSPVQ